MNLTKPDFANTNHALTLQFWQSTFDFAQGRREIAREHLNSSQIFEFGALSQNIDSVLSHHRTLLRNYKVTYPENIRALITTIVNRY